jgi:hypothetical protein
MEERALQERESIIYVTVNRESESKSKKVFDYKNS